MNLRGGSVWTGLTVKDSRVFLIPVCVVEFGARVPITSRDLPPGAGPRCPSEYLRKIPLVLPQGKGKNHFETPQTSLCLTSPDLREASQPKGNLLWWIRASLTWQKGNAQLQPLRLPCPTSGEKELRHSCDIQSGRPRPQLRAVDGLSVPPPHPPTTKLLN